MRNSKAVLASLIGASLSLAASGHLATGGRAGQSQSTSPGFMSWPDVHGDQIVFTSEGDLWLGSLKSKTAHRLTSDPGMETNARFSPDGSMIAFTAQYDGPGDIYIMPAQGGIPVRLTYGILSCAVRGFTPDGKSVLFTGFPKDGAPEAHLFTVPIGGGEPTQIAVPRGAYGSYLSPDELVYNPTVNEWANWYRYQAGRHDEVWVTNLKTHSFRKVSHDPFVDRSPIVCDGKVYVMTEKSGVSNLAELNLSSGDLKVETHFENFPASHPGTDGHTIIFQHGGGLATYIPSTGQVQDLDLELYSDRIHMRHFRQTVAGHVLSWSIGPTGKRFAVESEGQIVSIPAKEGVSNVVQSDGFRASLPAYSPDGQQVAFVDDSSGENRVYVQSATDPSKPARLVSGDTTGEFFAPVWSPTGNRIAIQDRFQRMYVIDVAKGTSQLVDDPRRTGSYDGTTPDYSFSRDGRYLAYSRTQSNTLNEIEIYDCENGKKAIVSPQDVNCTFPVFTFDGKYLAYLAGRDFHPEFTIGTGFVDKTIRINLVALSAKTLSPFAPKNDSEGSAEPAAPPKPPAKPPTPATPPATTETVDWDGIANRTISVPGEGTLAGKLVADATGLIYFDLTEAGAPTGSVVKVDLTTGKATPLVATATGFQVSADGKVVAFAVGPALMTIPVEGGAPTPAPLASANILVQPEKLWREDFEEGWRVARDFFYDPNMHGVDWKAVKVKYESELPKVAARSDVSQVLEAMESELNIGHCYVVDPTPGKRVAPIGYLGADFTSTPGTAGVQVAKILQTGSYNLDNSSPLASPGLGIEKGTWILAVDGQTLTDGESIEEALTDKAGQVVSLTVNSTPTMVGARTVLVKTITAGEQRGLYVSDYILSRAAYVKAKDPSLGYVYIPDMEQSGFAAFYAQQFPNVFKPGIIYDVRYNGGGFISGNILDIMNSKIRGWFHPRDGMDWNRWNWANIGHKVAICNEYCFSDAEYFSYYFKDMKIGKLIGHRTGGGEVGSGGGYALADGGAVYIPNYGAYNGDQWIVEGHGVDPDIAVDQDPAKVLAGDDPQLDAAIEELQKEIKAEPIQGPGHPPFPNKALKKAAG